MHLDAHIFKQLQEVDWDTIFKHLHAFTRYWLRRCGANTDPTCVIAKGMSIDDLVYSVVGKTVDGTRRWDPEKGDLLPWLKDQIKSEVDALLKSKARRFEVGMPDENQEEADHTLNSLMIEDGILHNRRPETPEEALIRSENIKENADLLLEMSAQDPELEVIWEAVMDGCEPEPRHLAKYLNIPVDDVYNRMKRFRRRVKSLRRIPYEHPQRAS